MSRPLLTGNWNGARRTLADNGVSFQGGYVGDFADSFSGGKEPGNGYAQQIAGLMDVNLGKLAGLQGASFHVGFNQRLGQSVSANSIGNQLSVQENYGAGETFRLTDLYYEQDFLGGKVDAKIGFIPMGAEFGDTPLLCDFQNVGFCIHPANLDYSGVWSNYPIGQWGGLAKVYLNEKLYIQAGIFDVNPTYATNENGLKISLSGSTGVIIPMEAGLTTSFGSAHLLGHYKIGAYYVTADITDVAYPKKTDIGSYGGYILADQMLFSFDGTPARGLIGFAQAAYSDTAVFQNEINAGLIAKGPFKMRPNDYVAVGYVRAGINERVIKAKELSSDGSLMDLSEGGEGVVEAGYGLQVTPSFLVYPNLQYVIDPGLFSYKHYSNAWVYGMQTKVLF